MRRQGFRNATLMCATLAGVAVPGWASAAVAFGATTLRAYADPYGPAASQVAEFTSSTLPAMPAALSVHAKAPNDGAGTSQGSATFVDSTRGQVTIEMLSASGYYGFSPNYPGGSGANVGFTFGYTFTTNSAYVARIGYDVAFSGNAANEVGASYKLYNAANVVISSEFFNQPGDGVIFSDAFGPGTYRLQIEGLGSLAATETTAHKTGTVSGVFAFNLLPNSRLPASPTPEPTTWALLLAGFGWVGHRVRRTRDAIRLTSSARVRTRGTTRPEHAAAI